MAAVTALADNRIHGPDRRLSVSRSSDTDPKKIGGGRNRCLLAVIKRQNSRC